MGKYLINLDSLLTFKGILNMKFQIALSLIILLASTWLQLIMKIWRALMMFGLTFLMIKFSLNLPAKYSKKICLKYQLKTKLATFKSLINNLLIWMNFTWLCQINLTWARGKMKWLRMRNKEIYIETTWRTKSKKTQRTITLWYLAVI